MLALETADWQGIVAVIAALALFVQALRTGKVVGQTAHKVSQIDNAVNGKPPGATTMVSQIQNLTDQAFPPDTDEVAVLPLLRRIAVSLEELKTASDVTAHERGDDAP